jgi:hypothetical protein
MDDKLKRRLKREWADWEREIEIIKFYALAKQYGFYDPSCCIGYSRKFINKIRTIAGAYIK